MSIQRITPESYFGSGTVPVGEAVATTTIPSIPSFPQPSSPTVYYGSQAGVSDSLVLLGIVAVAAMVAVVALAFAFK